MITLTPMRFGSQAISLPDDLLWVDELTWSPVMQSTERGIFGTLIVEAMRRNGGRPITLQGSGDSAWIDRGTLKKIAELLSIPGQKMQLDIRGESFEVVFDHGVDEITRSITMEDVVDFSDKEDSDFYCALVLRFLEASEIVQDTINL